MKNSRKTSSKNLLEVVKDLNIPEIKQQHGQQLDTDPEPVAAAEINAPDYEENKAQPHKLSVISEKVSEDDSWADQSKIRQNVEGSSRFHASISYSNASLIRVFDNSC